MLGLFIALIPTIMDTLFMGPLSKNWIGWEKRLISMKALFCLLVRESLLQWMPFGQHSHRTKNFSHSLCILRGPYTCFPKAYLLPVFQFYFFKFLIELNYLLKWVAISQSRGSFQPRGRTFPTSPPQLLHWQVGFVLFF